MAQTKSKPASRPPSAPDAPAEALRVTPEQRYHMIAEAAYFRAERRGFSGGDPAQDWLDAEAEVDRILQAGGAARPAGVTPKQAFQAALERQLRELDTRLEELKLKASLAKMELRSEYEKQLAAVAGKRATAQARLNELRDRAEDAWEDLKGGTEKAWDDMREALERLATRFK
jgi:hypothetical protein